jgi:hypothetical protein
MSVSNISILSLPGNCAEVLTGNKALEERLLREVLVVGLKVLLGGRAELHGNQLEAVSS